MKKQNYSNHQSFLLILAALILMACNLSSPNIQFTDEPIEQIMTPTPETKPLVLELPADLYYLDEGQIWRFNRDDHTINKITTEPKWIDCFDYSQASQLLVYISDNQLILADKDGNNRQVLRTGAGIGEIIDDLVRLNDQHHITAAIRTPHWSQDGRQVAFVENGLNIIDLETNQVITPIENNFTFGSELVIENLLSWSPDGRRFLLSLYAVPLERLFDRDTTVFSEGDYYIRYPSANHAYNSGKLTIAWSQDSSQYYQADADFGGLSAFMRCEFDEDDCVFIGDERPAHTYYFYAHPFAINEEEVMVFIGSSNEPDHDAEKFRLYRMTYQGYGIKEVRSDAYVPESALWSPDGNGVLITLSQPVDNFQAGTVVWLTVDDQPAMLLPIKNPGNLRWGSAP